MSIGWQFQLRFGLAGNSKLLGTCCFDVHNGVRRFFFFPLRLHPVIGEYTFYSPSLSSRADLGRTNQQEVERSAVEKRFAYALLEKLLVYLDNAGQRLQPVKPSQGFTRRNSFKQSSQDVKFFSKVSITHYL